MEDTVPTGVQDTHLVWEPPGHDIAILLSFAVIDRLKGLIEQAHDVEIGGILLGRREGDVSSGKPRIVVIDDFEPVESEHLRGTAYAVSQRDIRALDSTLTRQRPEGANVPVGFYRSHLRKGLYLDEADFSLFREYFSGDSDVFLVARPEADGVPVAGFFFWEDGMLERRTSYEHFPLDRRSLEGGEYSLLRGPNRPVEAAPVYTPAPEPRPHAVPPPRAADPRSRRAMYAAIGGALILATLIWAAVLRFGGQGEDKSLVSLTVARVGNALRVSWDPNAPAVEHANNAILWVTDGDKRRGLELNSTRLKQGNYVYTPESSVVNFRLDLLKVLAQGSESVRYVADRGAESPAAPVTKPTPSEAKASAPPATAPPAEEAAPSPAPAEQAKSAPPAKPRIQPVVSITTQAVPPSRVRSLIAKVPLVRSLQRGKYRGGESFVPPRTVREVMPHVPPHLAKELPADVRVDLKVTVDANGNVKQIDLLSRGTDERLASIAADALRQWHFEPARFRDKPVSCDLLATLNFRNGGSSMLMAQRD